MLTTKWMTPIVKIFRSVCSYRKYEQQKNLGMIVRALQKRDKERREKLKATNENRQSDEENVELKQQRNGGEI